MELAKLPEQSKVDLPHYEPHKATEEEWEATGGVICPVCRKEVTRLLPYGYTRERKACPGCIENRNRVLDQKARVLANKKARPARNTGTAFRLMLIKYNNKKM